MSSSTPSPSSSKSPSIRRILADVRELERHPSSRYHATPLEENMFEWHFTIRGPTGSDFDGGVYHGRILLPAEYPFKPPNIVFLTKNGRFDLGVKICLSISAYHEESWQPAWGIRTMLEAIISFLPSEGAGAIGALDWTKEERQKLAVESHDYECSVCGRIVDLLSHDSNSDKPDSEIASQILQLQLGNSKSSSSTPATVSTTNSDIVDNPSDTVENSCSTTIAIGKTESGANDLVIQAAVTSSTTATLVIDDVNEEKYTTDDEDVSAPIVTTAETPASIKAVRRRLIALRHTTTNDPIITGDTDTDNDDRNASTSTLHQRRNVVQAPAIPVPVNPINQEQNVPLLRNHDMTHLFLQTLIIVFSTLSSFIVIKKVAKFLQFDFE